MINEEQLKSAEEARVAQGGFIGTQLVKLGFLTEGDLLATLSSHYGVPIIELETATIDEVALKLVPHNLAQKHGLLPIVKDNNSLSVAMIDPSNIAALNDIRFITGLDLKVNIVSETALKAAIEKHYEAGVSYDKIFSDIEGTDVEVVQEEEEVSVSELERATEDAPVVKLVNAILTDAIKKRASDIHVEPYEKYFRVRFRIDGVMYEIMRPPNKLKNAITSRLKIMAQLDIAERRLPQDGRIKLKLGGNKEMDYRVNCLPTLFGEKIVLRLLDKSSLQLDMTKLGFEEHQLVDFKEAISRPFGMVLVTGPTGSGKTTTLYSALSELNKITTNIVTAEDPVEYNLQGINQAQMNEDIGFTFAAALRAFLRQDPNVILVGEIRDYETAEIAIKASLTGHLVLSTLHTNDAPSTINRLLNMGVEPFLVASSLNLILAQRLARRLCNECKAEVAVDPQILVDLGVTPAEAKHMQVFQQKGCEKCNNTGYRGRIALYEVMPMRDQVRQLILTGSTAAEIKREAIKQGMKTLRMSALIRLKEGVTSIDEVVRVTASDN